MESDNMKVFRQDLSKERIFFLDALKYITDYF